MRLHVRVVRAEQLFCTGAGEVLHNVGVLAAAVIALAGVALRVFVGENGSGGFQHRARHEIFAGDHLQTVVLTLCLKRNLRCDIRVRGSERSIEINRHTRDSTRPHACANAKVAGAQHALWDNQSGAARLSIGAHAHRRGERMATQIIPFPKLATLNRGVLQEPNPAEARDLFRAMDGSRGLHLVEPSVTATSRCAPQSQQTALRIVADVCIEHNLLHPACEPMTTRASAFWAALPMPPARVETPFAVARRLARMILARSGTRVSAGRFV